MTRRTPRLRAALAAALALAACSARRDSPEQHEVVAAVRRYDEQLPQAYARSSATLLAGVATADQVRRVDDLLQFLAQGRMVMDARQESFAAGEVTFRGDRRAVVETTEVWWYRHVRPDTGEVKQAPRRVRYGNRYHLVRADGRWLVDRLEETGWKALE